MGLRIMLLRAVLTTAFVAVGLTAVVVVECTTSIIELLDDELSSVCTAVGFLGSDTGLWAAIGLAGFAVLGVAATWGPVIKARIRQRRHEPARALVDNLGRLAEVGTQLSEIDDVPTLDEIQVARLVRRVEAVEVAILSDVVPSREATEQWMRLLQEANRLHNTGILATEQFKEINTRLLDLFTAPQDGAGGVSGASSP
jgi:hypothetical protein